MSTTDPVFSGYSVVDIVLGSICLIAAFMPFAYLVILKNSEGGSRRTALTIILGVVSVFFSYYLSIQRLLPVPKLGITDLFVRDSPIFCEVETIIYELFYVAVFLLFLYISKNNSIVIHTNFGDFIIDLKGVDKNQNKEFINLFYSTRRS